MALAKFSSQVNAMRRRRVCEDREGGRREAVPGVSSLTTCDELREARSEIKRVPENSRGSARSNYLHEAQGPTVESTFFLRLFLISPAPPDQLSLAPSHFLRVAFAVRCGARATTTDGGEGRAGKGNYFGLLFIPNFGARAIAKKRNEKRDVELTEHDATHKLRRGPSQSMRRTAGRNLISLASEFLSKSRVSRLI